MRLDGFLGGSLPRGAITDVYGPSGAGKTQLLHQICARAADRGISVVYVDTTGSFRPERILQMCSGHNALDHITVLRAMSVSDQISIVHSLGRACALIIDNVTDLFLYEYAKEDYVFARNRLLMNHMLELSYLALNRHMPVVLTNMIRYSGTAPYESMSRTMDIYTHIKIHLSGYPDYSMQCRIPRKNLQLRYTLDSSGVKSV